MTNWINIRPIEKYNGCLLILNIGEENFGLLPEQYRESLKDWVSKAHAGGHITIYAFDADTGPFRVPDLFDDIEGMDFVRMMFDVCGRRDSNFSLSPSERAEEFKQIGEKIRTHDRYRFSPQDLNICGKCKIDGTEVLLPITAIP